MNRNLCRGALLGLVCFAPGCMQVARVFLDIPNAGPGERAAQEGVAISAEMLDSVFRALQAGPQRPPPPIESVEDLDSVLSLLPADRAGSIDWVTASREGIIHPLPTRPGGVPDSTRVFPFDFYLQADDGPEAFFPHSVHQDWVACQSCHPRVYRRRGVTLSADDIHGTASCGLCHSGVAFPITSCERCHETGQDLPAGRSEKVFGGTLEMERAPAGPAENGDGTYLEAGQQFYPPAVFPHGIHRLRFQCRACHETSFAMVKGSSRMSQEEAHGEAGCGFCHDGIVAFETGFDACYRCHVEGSPGTTGSP